VPGEDDRPGILVVLPTLGDRLSLLVQTLASVDLQRSDVRLTLAVVLPATATAAQAIALEHGAVVVEDPRRGISHAINLGIGVATDERYYAWIGDDDLFRPGGLAALQGLIRTDDEAVVAFGACDYVDDAGRVLFTNRSGRLARFLLPWGPDLIPHPGSLIRLDAMRRVGLFDTDLRYAMDLDLFLKLRSQGRFLSTTRSVSAFRWHPDSLTVANRRASTDEAQRIKRSHLPPALRPLSPAWDLPVRWASARAARTVSQRARRLRERS
jgi:GT2 family glycosyltransferase